MHCILTRILFALLASMMTWPTFADESQSSVALVRSILQSSPSEMSFADAKIIVDRFTDPSIDVVSAFADLDEMAAKINKMLSTLPAAEAETDMEKMKAMRVFIYESGHWNDQKPFQYDLADPFGQQPGAQMLTRYLATRKGNCVSMPMLFLALGEKLGLDFTLSTAPMHIFVKFTDRATGKTWNLETTSGAGFTRDEHYRRITPMADDAVANGVYLRALNRREALALIATGVLDHLLATSRYGEAIEVADLLIAANPVDAYSLTKKGTAYYRLLEREFIRKYPTEKDIPPAELPRAIELTSANREAFAKAEALGWREPKLN